MTNKRRVSFSLYILVGACLFASGPWATITYAEGKSFMLVRGGKSATYSVDTAGVFGMELLQGDILQTAASTFLEISVNSVRAAIQVAENTSFKCDADQTGAQVTGELYYGRIRAKVAKLAGTSSFRITTPSLVAGVRGTDFGCDVIAVRGAKTTAGSAGTPVLNRVFCYSGSVAVSPSGEIAQAAKEAGKSAPETVVIGGDEMVESVVSDGAVPVMTEPLKKKAISEDVNQFWEDRHFAETPSAPASPSAQAAGAVSPVGPAWPKGREEEPSLRNLKIPAIAAAALVFAGTVFCAGTAYYSANADSGAVLVDPLYSAGIIMVGSGSILALVSSLFD